VLLRFWLLLPPRCGCGRGNDARMSGAAISTAGRGPECRCRAEGDGDDAGDEDLDRPDDDMDGEGDRGGGGRARGTAERGVCAATAGPGAPPVWSSVDAPARLLRKVLLFVVCSARGGASRRAGTATWPLRGLRGAARADRAPELAVVCPAGTGSPPRRGGDGVDEVECGEPAAR